MRTQTVPARRPAASMPLARAAVAGLLAAAIAAGCGSSGSESGGATTDASAFCDAVAQYVEASDIGDRTAMADALSGSLDDLSPEAERDVSAYVDALRQAPANDQLDGDGVEAPSTEEAFRSLVDDTCGDDVELPPEAKNPTTTEAPIVQGGGSSTDDTGVDGSGTGTDSGAGGSGDAGTGMGG